MKTTAPCSPKAIALIVAAREAGHRVFFSIAENGDTVEDDRNPGVPVVAYYSPSRHEHVTIWADGASDCDFTGEDADVEAAIERRNDAWASEQQWIEDRHRGLC